MSEENKYILQVKDILILNLMRVLALMIQIQEMLMDHISRDRELKYIIHMLRVL